MLLALTFVVDFFLICELRPSEAVDLGPAPLGKVLNDDGREVDHIDGAAGHVDQVAMPGTASFTPTAARWVGRGGRPAAIPAHGADGDRLQRGATHLLPMLFAERPPMAQ